MIYSNVMLDLETMGNGSNAAIVAIGACAFDIEGGEIGPGYYNRVDLESAVRGGGVMDASTVRWWLGIDDSDARQEIAREGAMHLNVALTSFSQWLEATTHADVAIWGNGANFDGVILRNAYGRAERPVPWKWWNERCYRTVKSLYPEIRIERLGTAHNALDDAVSQARHLITLLHPAKREEAILLQQAVKASF